VALVAPTIVVSRGTAAAVTVLMVACRGQLWQLQSGAAI
jgi:hypothetical protein